MNVEEIPPYSLLFFRGTGLISRWIGRFSGANLDGPTHVEIVLPPEACLLFGLPPRPVSFGATTLADTPDLVTGKRQSGVQLWDLERRIGEYRGTHIWVRKNLSSKRRLTNVLAEFIKDEHGKPYERSPFRLLGVVIDWPWIDDMFNADSEEERFCSELAVRMLRMLRIWVHLSGYEPCEEYSPMDLYQMRNWALAKPLRIK